jgi:hypothetical protein
MHRQSMYDGSMQEELEQFVASLEIPADRKEIVLAELLDHVASATEAARRAGEDPEAAARAAIGDLQLLRRSLEAIEPAFRITRKQTFARGLVASLLVALVIDQGGAIMTGFVGAVAAIAIVVLLAPPSALVLLRAELRRPRVGRGISIGPALVYAATVISAPFVMWIALIVQRAFAGNTRLETPYSAFAVVGAVSALLLVEGLRARRKAIA